MVRQIEFFTCGEITRRTPTQSLQKKIEGIGWESERVAFRLYFDQRNAIDLYGENPADIGARWFRDAGLYLFTTPLPMDAIFTWWGRESAPVALRDGFKLSSLDPGKIVVSMTV